MDLLFDHADALIVEPFPELTQTTIFEAPDAPDKSITHRAVILAAMAQGTSVIHHPLMGDDCQATCDAFKKLGVQINGSTDANGSKLTVESRGATSWHSPASDVHLGNSGTSARLLTGLFASIPQLKVVLDGDHSLRRRPMARVVEPLRSMGADIESEHGSDVLKLTITGSSLTPQKHKLATPSAQIKSALLLAGSSCRGRTVIEMPEGGRDHTEVMMASLGAQISVHKYLGTEVISLDGPWRPLPFQCSIPNDPSSLAFFAAMAAIHPGFVVTGQRVLMNKTRIEFFNILSLMGVQIDWTNISNPPEYLGEFVADIKIHRSMQKTLKAVTVCEEQSKLMLDEMPILAVVAACAMGQTVIEGLRELRVKESDRLAMIVRMLSLAGISVENRGDDLYITGGGAMGGFKFASDDHRMVMSAIILATICKDSSEIGGLKWIQTSFPLFMSSFQTIKTMLIK